jgi:hypothetical protein
MKLRLRRRKNKNTSSSNNQGSGSLLKQDQGQQSDTWEPIQQQQQQQYLLNSKPLGLEEMRDNTNDNEVELFPINVFHDTNKMIDCSSISGSGKAGIDNSPTSIVGPHFSMRNKTNNATTSSSSLLQGTVKISPNIRDTTPVTTTKQMSALQQKRQKMILMRRRLVGGGGGGNNNSSGGGKKGGDNGGANDGGMMMKKPTTNEERSSIPSAVMIDKTTNQDNPNLSTITLATDEESSCGTVDKGILLLDVSSLAERSCPTTPTDIKEWFATRNNTVALSSSLFEDVDASVEVESVVKSCSNSVEVASVVKSSNDNAVTRYNLLEDSNVPPLPVQDLVAKKEEEEENNEKETTTNNYSIHSPAKVLLSTTMMSGQQQQIEKRLLSPSIVLAKRLSRKASNRSQQSHDASSTTVVRQGALDEDEAQQLVTLDNDCIETSSPPSSNLNSNQLGTRDMTDTTILKRAQLHSHTRSNISNASSSADAGSGSERNSICMADNNPTNPPTPRSRTKKKSTISDYFCIPTVSSSDIHQVTTNNNNETIVVGGTTCSSESPTGISDFPLTGNNNSMAEKKTKKNVDDATCNSDDTEKTTNATGMKIVDSNGEDVGGNKSSNSNSKSSRNNNNPTVPPPPDGGGCTDIFDDIAKFFTCQFGNTKDILEVVAEDEDFKTLELEENQKGEEEGDANNTCNNNTSTIHDETNSKAEGIIQPRELFDATWFESPSQLKDDFLINNNKEDDDNGVMNDSSSVGEASVELCLLGVDDRNLLKSKNSWDTTTSKQSSRSTSQSYSSMSSMARNLLKTVGGKRSSSKDTESNTSETYISPPEIQRNHHQSDDIFNTHSQSQDEISYGSLTTFDDDTMDNSDNQVDEFPCDETASAATTISKEETILSKETDAMSFRSEESNPTWFDKCVEGGCTFAPADDQHFEDYSYTSAELALRTHYIESQDCIVARDNSLYPAISTNSTNTASLHDRSRANRYQKRKSKGGTNWRHEGGLDSCLTDGTDRTGLTDDTDRTGLTDETDRTGLTDETDRTDNGLLASCLTDGTRTDNDMSTVGSGSRSSDFTPLESRNEELYKYDTSSVHSESIMSESNRDTTHGQQDTIKTPRIGSGIKRTGSRIRTLAQSILPYKVRSSDSVSEVDSIR